MDKQLFDILKTPQPLDLVIAAMIRAVLSESDFESTFGVEPETAKLILWIWEAAQLDEWDAETLAEFVGTELFPDKKIMLKRIEAGLPKKFAPEVGFDWLEKNYIPFGDFDKWYFENKPIHIPLTKAALVNTNGKKWTIEKLEELAAYRLKHTMQQTAAQYGISEQRIRRLLPSKKTNVSPFSGLIHRAM